MRASRSEVASIFGVPCAAIDGWVRRGCPVKERSTGRGYGRGAKFWIPDVVAWREDALHAATPDLTPIDNSAKALRVRLLRAQAESAEIDLEGKQRTYITTSQYETHLANALERVAAKLRESVPRHAAVVRPDMASSIAAHEEVLQGVLQDLCDAADVPEEGEEI